MTWNGIVIFMQLALAVFLYEVNSEITDFENRIADNKDAISLAENRISLLKDRLERIESGTGLHPQLERMINEHEQKIQLLNSTLNGLHPSIR